MHSEFFNQTIATSSIPIINPNFARYDHQIFFSLGKQHRSNRAMASLTEAEQDLFDAIDGHLNLKQLNDCFAPVMANIAHWHEMGVVEYIDNPRPASDDHLLVLEPHMDDAALSVGGALLKRKDQQHISVMTMVGQSNFTSYSKSKSFATDSVSHRRLLESNLVCKMLNATHLCLNQVDQPLRWRDDHQAVDLASQQVNEQLADVMAANILPLKINELWIPMAIEFHADHHRTRNAALVMLDKYQSEFPGVKIVMYEDVPYANDFCHEFKMAMLDQLYGEGQPHQCQLEDISAQLQQKQRLTAVFGSQFKASFIDPKTTKSAVDAAQGEGYAERLWHFPTTPNGFDEDFFERFGDCGLLYQQLMAATRVKLFYNDFFIHGDFNLFLQLFPHLTIDLYVPELEVNRVKGIDLNRVNLTLHANGLDALAQQIALQADNLPMIATNYELHWQANREAISAKYNGDNLYQSCWFSSLVIALRQQAQR